MGDTAAEERPVSNPPSDQPVRRFDVVRNRALLTLMLGHMTIDMYVGVLPILYPLLTDKFDVSLKSVGLVSFAYGGMASITQPLFGWLTDRRGARLVGLALMWTAWMFALIGFAPTFPVLLLLAALAGVGSGAYHPMGAVTARAVITERQRNTAMSIYVTGGTLGVAIGPLIGAFAFFLFGVEGTALMIIPGAAISILLIVEMRSISERVSHHRETTQDDPAIAWKPLSVVVGSMMVRAWVLFGISAFIPLWYEELGYSTLFYALLSTTLLVASAVGTVGVGTIADKHGRKLLLIWSSILTIPCILLFAQFPGYPGFLTAILIGFLVASVGPLLLVMAQELMAGRPGMASGLILGLGFVMGAIGVPVMGAIADKWGIQNAMRGWAIIAAMSIVLAWMLPSDEEVREIASQAKVPSNIIPQPAVASAGEAD